ncbi:MAG TPA: LytTR family DNA-binding domain-containing protein [Steroidobacteraceae bacterium]|nr:LytTR family DNA-binding domain-containing protein [Steroidobacteraceae bacterium]
MAPTALIADDEPKLAQDLAERLKQLWSELDIVALVPNGIQAVAELNRLRPQYAFLDIRMPGLSGLEAAKAATGTRVVFVTAYDEYAVAAFDAAAADYLLKPVSDARLAQCIARLQRESAPPLDLRKLMSSLATPAREYLAWLTVGLANTTRLVAVKSVLYFQSTGKYTEVVTAHEKHLIRTSLKDLLQTLDPQAFVQIHRGTIVNVAAIERIERDVLGRCLVHLKDHADVLPVSRTFAGVFKQM